MIPVDLTTAEVMLLQDLAAANPNLVRVFAVNGRCDVGCRGAEGMDLVLRSLNQHRVNVVRLNNALRRSNLPEAGPEAHHA